MSKIIYAITRIPGSKEYLIQRTKEFNSKENFKEYLRNNGRKVKLVFTEMDYRKIHRTVTFKGEENLTENQFIVYKSRNYLVDTIEESGMIWRQLEGNTVEERVFALPINLTQI